MQQPMISNKFILSKKYGSSVTKATLDFDPYFGWFASSFVDLKSGNYIYYIYLSCPNANTLSRENFYRRGLR